MNAKSERIASFVAEKIFFNYIPAIRTDKEALSVISDMVSHELRVLEDNDDYKEALNVIDDLQQPILRELSKRIKEPLSEFLPGIQSVKIDLTQERRMTYRRDFDVLIDDGTLTSIEFKGDGVKSLATLGLLKNRYKNVGASIIAIEEPESHLHSAAIHQLNSIITSLSEENQVILTTHNPLFVDRAKIKTNIVIEDGKATPAKNVKQIRDLLGIKASDNLTNANFALVVEGEEDKVSLMALLPYLSQKIAKAIKLNLLVIEPVGGAGNLPYKLSLMKTTLCVSHVLADNDDAGRDGIERAKSDGMISDANYTVISCSGMRNSEFEDCIDPNVYRETVLSEFGVQLSASINRGDRKWSDRMKGLFEEQGKLWDKKVEMKLKYLVANSVANNPKHALNQSRRSSIDALVDSLERMVIVG